MVNVEMKGLLKRLGPFCVRSLEGAADMRREGTVGQLP